MLTAGDKWCRQEPGRRLSRLPPRPWTCGASPEAVLHLHLIYPSQFPPSVMGRDPSVAIVTNA